MKEELDVLESSFSSWLEEKTNLIGTLIEGNNILEVGCGTGNLIQFLSKMKLDIKGSDYSDVYLDKARVRNPNTKFFKKNLLEQQSWHEYQNEFDTVIASEVIEHIEDDLKALKTIHSVIKPNGVLLLTVPAFDFLYSSLDKKIGHFRRYTKKSITKVVENAGFTVEKISYWNLLGLLGWWISFKILDKEMNKVGNRFVGNILGKWLKIERKITMPIGLTVIVKARKK